MKFEQRDDEQKNELRQRLLELHYGLLDADEANELRRGIETDPNVASQWAFTLALAGKISDAAKFSGVTLPEVVLPKSALEMTPSRDGVIDDATRPVDAEAARRVVKTNSRSWWVRSSAVAATAAAIGMFVLGFWYRDRLPRLPRSVVSVQGKPIPANTATSDNEFSFVTTRMDASSSRVSSSPASSSPLGGFSVVPATLSFAVMSGNSILFSGSAQTDSNGSGRIQLPADLVIPAAATLKVTAKTEDGSLSETNLVIPLEPTRCLTYLSVDRPVYRPGETVYFRSLTLARRSLQPNNDVPIRFELQDPSGAVVPGASTEGVTDRGVGSGAFMIPSAAAGGSYTLVAKSLDGFFPDEKCDFQVRAYRVPRFKKTLEFRRRSYGPGGTVEADFSALRAEGGVLAGASVRVSATVDGKVVYQLTTQTSAAGAVMISFDLPSLIDEGAGVLSVVVDDGATQETKTKTIPIQLGRVAVDFYPEGGYLVDGLKNRVYFAARDSLGKPIHIEGEIQTRSGQSVAKVQTQRDGMGRFALIPQQGEQYTLKVTQPVDATGSPQLPRSVKDLPVIDTGGGVFSSDSKAITVSVRTKNPLSAVLRAVCRGRLVGERKVQLSVGDNLLSLPIRDDSAGVIRVTVFDAATAPARPLVERLVYRRSEKALQVEIVDQASALQRSPGEPLRLTLQVRDETGDPTAAVLGVSIVDDAALSLTDTERPGLRTHFLLTSEVEKPADLEHANFYLNDGHEAAQALDLLLGTQGWRRFVSGSQSQPNSDFRQQLIRLLELDGEGSLARQRTYDNSARFAPQWIRYHEATRFAWQRLLQQSRALMLGILFLWLILILFHMRRHVALKAAMWLLGVSASVCLYGCSSGETSVVVGTASSSVTAKSAAIDRERSVEAAFVDEVPVDHGLGMNESDAERMSVNGPVVTKPTATPIHAGELDGSKDSTRHLHAIDPISLRVITRQELSRLLAARGMDAESLADQLLDELRFPVRQYAHRHLSTDDGLREDFAETLYWHPMLITDSQGRVSIRFDLSDSITTFRVNVDGHTAGGRIGSGGGEITSRIPFQIEPKLPLEVTAGDRIDLPIAVINATDAESEISLTLTADDSLQPVGDHTRRVKLAASGRTRESISLSVVNGSAEHDAKLEIRGSGSGSLSDSLRRSIHISPAGYPDHESIAGRLSGRARIRLPIPDDIVPGSLAVTVRAYPSPLADVMSGVESILREPHGCFEQTSATNYPNTMALLYLRESQTANPDVARRAQGMLNRGYQKLTSFECTQRGYEWFGQDPGHEALSAFGLMQFTDMSQVMAINGEMLVRTRQWLMGRRDGEGGFRRNPRHLHVWSIEQEIVNAYVLWAISEADVATGHPRRTAGELGPELDQLAAVASASKDPYLVGLSAATLMNVKRTGEGERLLEKLSGLQQKDGSLTGTTTITSSGGISRTMETTAIGTLAWVKSKKFVSQARGAATWISENRQGNAGFGSTQATVLALKALVAMSGHSPTDTGGVLHVELDGEIIGHARLPDEPRSGSTVEIEGLGEMIEAARNNEGDNNGGEMEIELVAEQSQHLSYTVNVAYHAITPNSDKDCPLKLTTEWKGELASDGSVASGETLEVSCQLTNETSQGQPMTVAIIGLPGGVEARSEELDELQEAGRFDYYEVRGREVVFYWRTIHPDAVKQVDFHVTAAIPGRYTGPASRTHLYYTAEQKSWSQPLKIEIKP